MKKTNWKTKLKTVLEKDAFSEASTNSQLPKTDKSRLSFVSSVIVSANLVDTSEKSTDSPEINKLSDLVSSAFVSGQLADNPRNNNEVAEIKSNKLHEVLNRFIEKGITFDVSTTDFQVIDAMQNLKTSDIEFLELNYSIILCQLQQSLLMKHLFSHSPEQFEDFAFEIYERESLLTKAAKTSFEIYFEAVESTTRKWFTNLLGKDNAESRY